MFRLRHKPYIYTHEFTWKYISKEEIKIAQEVQFQNYNENWNKLQKRKPKY